MGFLYLKLCGSSCPFNGYCSEESGCTFSAISHQVFMHIARIPLNLLFSRLSSHSSSNLYIRQILPSLKSSLWSFTGLCARSPYLPCVEEARTGPSTPDVSREGSSSSPCWRHFSWCSPGCCWCSTPQGCIVDFSLVSTRLNRSFLARLLSSWSAPCWYVELFLPKCRAFHFPLWMLMRFLPAHFSSLSSSLCKAAQPSREHHLPSPVLHGLWTCWACSLPVIQVIKKDTKQSWPLG